MFYQNIVDKWGVDPIFMVVYDGFLCKSCLFSFSSSKKKLKYISVPAKPNSKRDMEIHLNCEKHKIGYALFCKRCEISGKETSEIQKEIVEEREEVCMKEMIELEEVGSVSKAVGMSESVEIRETSPPISSILTESADLPNAPDKELTTEEKALVSVIVDKFNICMWLMQSNVSNDRFCSLQKLIDLVGKNKALKIFGHNSYYSFKQFVFSLREAYVDKLKNSISFYKLYSILLDDSVNVCGKNEMCVYVRYIDSSLRISTKFLALKELGVKGATSQNLYDLLNEVLVEFHLEISNMVAVCTDGASNMRGDVGGLLALIRKKIPGIIDYYCSCHRLNLVIQKSMHAISTINDTINTAVDISNYISGSSNRLSHISHIQMQLKKTQNRIVQPVATRWSSVHDCIQSITEQLTVVLIFMNEEHLESPSQKLKNLINEVENPLFISNIAIVDVIFHKLNIVMLKFQEKNLDFGIVEDEIERLKEELQNKSIDNEIISHMEKLTVYYEEFLNYKKLQKIPSIEKLQYIINTTQKLITTIIYHIDDRFTSNTIVSSLIKLFHPKSLREEAVWEDNRILYGKVVKVLKNIFSYYRYKQKFQDFDIFKRIIIPQLPKKNKLLDIFESVVTDHRFTPTVTTVRLAQICALIPA
jgi:hypothetical protein